MKRELLPNPTLVPIQIPTGMDTNKELRYEQKKARQEKSKQKNINIICSGEEAPSPLDKEERRFEVATTCKADTYERAQKEAALDEQQSVSKKER